jgi:general secretion pathway protein A
MYESFFGFQHNPFGVTPDPRFFFETTDHRDALAYLTYGVKERKGFLVLTGEVGVGKTMCIRAFLRSLGESCRTALILNSSLPFGQLLTMALDDLGIPPRRRNKAEMLLVLTEYLIQASELNRDVLLVIDEAQNLKPAVLEEIRQLSNLEDDHQKLLTIVLAGQPELRSLLATHKMRQLRQRIPGVCQIGPLSADDVAGYIGHRLEIASLGDARVRFTEGGIRRAQQYAGGLPRLVNLVCDRALLVGYVWEKFVIGDEEVQTAIQELERGGILRQSDLAARPAG